MRHRRIDLVIATVILFCTLAASGAQALTLVPKQVQYTVIDVDGITVIIPLNDPYQNANAADIPIINNAYGNVSVSQNGSAHELGLRGANSVGFSINRFENFDLGGSPLRIINDAGDSLDGNETPQTIVIIADNINLNNEIEIVGPMADILFIATAPNGSINCTLCTLKNVARATFAVANPTVRLDDDNPAVGLLGSTPNGKITLNNLLAPGALMVDLLADVIDVQNTVSTNIRASRSAVGGYELNAYGSHSMGGGSVNFYNGRIGWNYDTQEIDSISPQQKPIHTISGQIYATGVNIYSSEGLRIAGQIDTRTDLLSTYRYRGQTHITREGVKLKAFGNAPLEINGRIATQDHLEFASAANIAISADASLRCSTCEIVAVADIVNNSVVLGKQTKFAGKSVINNGLIEGFSVVEVWADYNVSNQFGGEIRGNQVSIQSAKGLIRNGSRAPYIQAESEVSSFLSYAPSDVTPAWPAPFYMGTFYEINPDISSPKWRAASYAAVIIGDKVHIKAPAFENINPYWENRVDNKFLYYHHLTSQVAISAESELTVDSSNYLVNSSAILQLNNPSGVMALKSGLIINERYRVASLMQAGNLMNILYTGMLSWSPPGVMYSFGSLRAEASAGFLNNMSYIEVYGNAEFVTPHLNDMGLEDTGAGVQKVGGVAKYYDILSNNEGELDSLFYVGGDFYGIRPDGTGIPFAPSNQRPFDTMRFFAALNVLNYASTGGLVNGAHGETVNILGSLATIQSDVRIEGGNIIQNFSYQWSDGTIAPPYETKIYSLFDELKKMLANATEQVRAILSEIDWWN